MGLISGRKASASDAGGSSNLNAFRTCTSRRDHGRLKERADNNAAVVVASIKSQRRRRFTDT